MGKIDPVEASVQPLQWDAYAPAVGAMNDPALGLPL